MLLCRLWKVLSYFWPAELPQQPKLNLEDSIVESPTLLFPSNANQQQMRKSKNNGSGQDEVVSLRGVLLPGSQTWEATHDKNEWWHLHIIRQKMPDFGDNEKSVGDKKNRSTCMDTQACIRMLDVDLRFDQSALRMFFWGRPVLRAWSGCWR